jgi:Ankyrin repeats (3 copies)/Ankyrin repeat
LVTGSGAYDHAYEDAMERINGQVKDQEELAKQVLSWITCAKRQLTTTELQHALRVEVGESKLDEENFPQIEDILSICAGLVTIDEESRVIRLVHYTTQEYFERTQRQWFPNAQTNISTICVTYLSFNEFESGICQNNEDFERRLQVNKLYDYAAHNWGYHAREASVLIPEVVSFLKRKTQLEASSQGLLAKKMYSLDTKYSQRFPKDIQGLHLVAYFGVEAVVKQLLEKGADVNIATSDGRTPLHEASRIGNVEVVKLLLEKGADVNTAKNDGSTPLHEASRGDNVEVVKLLLERGADIEAKDTKYGDTPLLWAVTNGHEAVVTILLGNNADVNTENINGWTAL